MPATAPGSASISACAQGSASVSAQGSAGVGAPSSDIGIPTSQQGSVSITTASVISIPGFSTSQGGSGGDAASLGPNASQGIWPSDTDLIFLPGTRKLTLTLQHPLLRAIVQDAFENLQAYLLLDHSFPDATALPTVIRGCLIVASTESQHPQGLAVRERLVNDDVYLDRLSRLVRVPYRQLSLC